MTPRPPPITVSTAAASGPHTAHHPPRRRRLRRQRGRLRRRRRRRRRSTTATASHHYHRRCRRRRQQHTSTQAHTHLIARFDSAAQASAFCTAPLPSDHHHHRHRLREISKYHPPQSIPQLPLSAMPPSTHRRTRARRAGSTPDHELPDSSPSRPRSKRRKLQELQEPQEATPLSQIDQVNAVIASLAMPDPNPMVAIQHANDENFRQNTQGITAYAKVAGATWTYYVKELVIRIGRPPDARAAGAAGSPTPPPQTKPDDVVHIDLGPSKLVSRNHATISYDQNGQYSWRLQVMGRNGLKVDDECYKKDSTIILRSGNIIEIGGVQMMFVLPDTEINISASVLRRSKAFQFPLEDDSQPQPTLSNESSNYDTSTQPSSQNARPSSSQQLLPPVSTDPISQPEVAIKRENAPAYHRGLVLESTEDVDYADDSMKGVKPPFSYALMIAQAILSSDGEQLTLACIYQYIQDKYAFYRHSITGWQNSIRHNLSLNKAFRKIPRRTDEPGKGMKWELLPEHRDEYIKKLQKPPKTGPGRQNSVPNSPSSPKSNPKNSSSQLQQSTNQPLSQSSSSQGLRLEDSQDLNMTYPTINHSLGSVTPPPITSYRVAPLEAYTPDRGSRLPALPALCNHDKPLIDTSVNAHHTRRASLIQPANTNEMISSSQNHHASSIHGDINTIPPSPPQRSPYADDNPAVTAMTPAPQRQHPRLAPPSTGQLPSSYLPTSSPAPFWKYIHFGSTPAKPNDYSPLKDLHSSSPPPAAGRDESGHGMRELGSPLKERGRGFRLGAGPQLVPDLKEEDEDEDGMGDLHGIDLTRGFEKIGKFHMNGRIAESDWAT